MITLNQEIDIPEVFRVANNEIRVVVEDSLPDNQYGYFNDATNTIKLARTIDTLYDGIISFSPKQIQNTFYHEVFHVFQFCFNNTYDEAQAQVYANFMCEFLESTNKPF